MHAVRLAPLTLALAVAAALPARAAQVPSDDALACLIERALDDGQSRPDDAKGDRIDPKVASEAAKAKNHKWWRSDEMRAQFGITDAQSVELEKIFQSFVAGLKSGMTEVDRYQKEVSRLMADPAASEVDVIQAINRLEAAKADLGRTRSLMLFRMYRVLTPEQRVKVKRFHEQKDAAASAPR
jgi:Spy/CpxP family protein refolding chaperone